jgi:hypothetical protein
MYEYKHNAFGTKLRHCANIGLLWGPVGRLSDGGIREGRSGTWKHAGACASRSRYASSPSPSQKVAQRTHTYHLDHGQPHPRGRAGPPRVPGRKMVQSTYSTLEAVLALLFSTVISCSAPDSARTPPLTCSWKRQFLAR